MGDDPHDVAHAAAGHFDERLQVLAGLPGLGRRVTAADELAVEGVPGLAGEPHQVAGSGALGDDDARAAGQPQGREILLEDELFLGHVTSFQAAAGRRAVATPRR